MIIDRLVLKNFKRFRSEEIKFRDGITGILGNNGTGKSSLVEGFFSRSLEQKEPGDCRGITSSPRLHHRKRSARSGSISGSAAILIQSSAQLKKEKPVTMRHSTRMENSWQPV